MIKLLLAGILTVNIYPQTLYVGGVDYDNNVVTAVDFNNIEYTFVGCEDWQEGDIVSAIMSDNGTPDNVTDDIIINKKYSGWIY